MHREYIEIYEKEDTIFAIDNENKEQIEKFLKKMKKDIGKVRLSYFELIIKNKISKNKYSTENYDSTIRNITALKFKGKKSNNARLYCKDFLREDGKRIIILCEPHPSKKQDKLSQKEKTIIKRVNNYEY